MEDSSTSSRAARSARTRSTIADSSASYPGWVATGCSSLVVVSTTLVVVVSDTAATCDAAPPQAVRARVTSVVNSIVLIEFSAVKTSASAVRFRGTCAQIRERGEGHRYPPPP